MCRRTPSLMSSTLRAVGAFSGNNARCTSSDEYRPARRTTTLSPASSHSRTEPGPTPSIRRTSAGTEICPCAVTFECASAMALSYHGNAHPARFPHISPRVVSFERRMALPAGIPACGHSRSRRAFTRSALVSETCLGGARPLGGRVQRRLHRHRWLPGQPLLAAIVQELTRASPAAAPFAAVGCIPWSGQGPRPASTRPWLARRSPGNLRQR